MWEGAVGRREGEGGEEEGCQVFLCESLCAYGQEERQYQDD